jgi:hypothetical protein
MPIKPSETVMVCRLYNEASYMLEQFLEHNSVFFEHFVALVDRSDDETFEIVNNHPKCIVAINRKTGGYQEDRDYHLLRTAISYFNHEWMLFLDADELLSHACLDELEEVPSTAMAACARWITLFPDQKSMITNLGGGEPRAIEKFYRRDPVLGFSKSLRVTKDRCLHPGWVFDGVLFHHNYLKEERRQRRHAIYKADKRVDAHPRQIKTDWIHHISIENDQGERLDKISDIRDYFDHLLETDLPEETKKDLQKLRPQLTYHHYCRFPNFWASIADFHKRPIIPTSEFVGK